MLDHGCNSRKTIFKLAAWSHCEKPIIIAIVGPIFCSIWPILIIKMSSMGFLGVLNRLKRVLKLHEIIIKRNSPFCFEHHSASANFIFIDILIQNWHSWYMDHYCHRAPQLLSMSGTIFIRGLLGMILAMVPGKKNWLHLGFRPFFNLTSRKYNLDNISSSNGHRVIILVSTPMVSG